MTIVLMVASFYRLAAVSHAVELPRGLPANAGLSVVDNGPVARTADKGRIATAASQAVADGLQVESEGDRKPPLARSITLVKSGQVQSEPAA